MSEITLPTPGAENQINNPPGNTQIRKKLRVSRRGLLRIGAAVGVAYGLAACGWPLAEQQTSIPAIKPAPTDLGGVLPNSPQGTTPASEPQVGVASSEPTPSPDKPFYTKEIDPETGIEIISKNDQFLSKEEFNQWSEKMKKTGEYLSDPKNRTTAFLIGHQAWEKWNSEGVLDGEKPLLYLKRHADRLNYALSQKTRASSGIDQLRLTPIVVLVDEDWIKDAPWWERQVGTSDTFGRWSWDSSYKPTEFLSPENTDKLTGLSYDDTLFHELWHYGFYNAPHLFNYVTPDFINWTSSLFKYNFKLGDIGNLRIWNNNLSREGNNIQLMYLTNALNNNVDYILTEPDELFARRNLVSAYPLYTQYDQVSSTEFFSQLLEDLSPEYAIDFGQIPMTDEKPILYKAWLKSENMVDTVEWVFDEKSQYLSCRLKEGKVILPDELINKLMVDAQGNETGLGCAYVLKVGERFYGFTNYHLYYWHWREQLKNGEQKIGKFGKPYPVSVPIEDWM